MDFLSGSRPKILRTRLYGDQIFTRFELNCCTSIMRRLCSLKQLGFTDRVYPTPFTRASTMYGATKSWRKWVKSLSRGSNHIVNGNSHSSPHSVY